MAGMEDIQASPPKIKSPEKRASIIEEIISRFKRGEINLPSFPQINIKFREMAKTRRTEKRFLIKKSNKGCENERNHF